MEVNEDFCQRINDGYRMEKPQYAPNSVYEIMKQCWANEPSDRPSFSELSDSLGEFISDWQRNRIADLNENYARLNQQSDINGTEDYLSRMKQAESCVRPVQESDSRSVSERYQEIPTQSGSNGTEPSCVVNPRDSQCKFVKSRPQPPPRAQRKY